MAAGYYTIADPPTGIWYTWNTSTTITSGTGSVYQYVWDNWVTSGTTSSTITYTTQGPIWNAWVEDEQVAQENRFWDQQRRDELQAQREQRNRERLAREQQIREDYKAASERAMTLLYDVLTPEEQLFFEEHDYLEITGTDDQRYRVEAHRNTVHGNIVRIDEHGCSLRRACVAPSMYGEVGALPTADGWVGQILGLKFDTEEFMSHANWSYERGCDQVAAA